MRTGTINNVAFASLAIALVASKFEKIELCKVLLIMPILANKELTSYLANGRTKIKSLDKLIIDKLHCFSNFNKRYYDNLSTSINAIQFLAEMNVLSIENSFIKTIEKIDYESSMGPRIKTAEKASENIAKLLSQETSNLYLNLRIEL